MFEATNFVFAAMLLNKETSQLSFRVITILYAACRFSFDALSSEQVFTSPNYPASYPNNLICHWTITAQPGKFIHIIFEDFQTESCCDHLQVLVIEV